MAPSGTSGTTSESWPSTSFQAGTPSLASSRTLESESTPAFASGGGTRSERRAGVLRTWRSVLSGVRRWARPATMRLWTLHPKYLDARGLVAAWREALLAQAVLRDRTRGYTKHPQLARFQRSRSPVSSIGAYLLGLHQEAARRGYQFESRRIVRPSRRVKLRATVGQLAYEWQHLSAKLAVRDRAWLTRMRGVGRPEAHPMFRVYPGQVEAWEVGAGRLRTRG